MNNWLKSRPIATFVALSVVIVFSSCAKKPEEAAMAPSPVASPSVKATSPTASPTTSPVSAVKESPEVKPTLSAEAEKLGVKPKDATTCPDNAKVKGKVTKKRGNIYHVAKEADYGKVKPDICFKDTAAAEKAGFRAPKQ
jgi:hypothetical protein